MKGEGRELGEILSSSKKPNVVPEVSLICFDLYIILYLTATILRVVIFILTFKN